MNTLSSQTDLDAEGKESTFSAISTSGAYTFTSRLQDEEQKKENQENTLLKVVVEASFNGRRYRAGPPLSFLVREDSGLFHLSGEFNIHLAHESCPELMNDILQEMLEYLWEEYAQEDISKLDSGARKLRDALLKRFEVIASG